VDDELAVPTPNERATSLAVAETRRRDKIGIEDALRWIRP
jgi:hypothetical protein